MTNRSFFHIQFFIELKYYDNIFKQKMSVNIEATYALKGQTDKSVTIGHPLGGHNNQGHQYQPKQ